MSVTDMFRGGGTNSRLYFAIGGLSLLKAIVVRNNKRRFRSELKDAALFLAVGMFLRRAEQRRTDKVADIDLLRQEVMRRFGGGETEQRGGLRSRLGGNQQPKSKSLPEQLFGQ